MNRKNFIQQVAFSTGTLLVAPNLITGQNSNTAPGEVEPLPAEKIKDFVVAGHNNLDKVKSLLVEMPTLLYATWDWGGGDFETAIEGAGHVGNKDIAQYLIAQGARANLFVLTMLGKTQLVKSFLELFPGYLTARGPHGLTLLHHAQRGGADAKELLEYIQSKGLKETKSKL